MGGHWLENNIVDPSLLGKIYGIGVRLKLNRVITKATKKQFISLLKLQHNNLVVLYLVGIQMNYS